ncbi:BrnT family toxin [Candidatus Collierbacteria bacterium]|nr:BrnT family toxin [Candidatus Collierbacteria bacterium]
MRVLPEPLSFEWDAGNTNKNYEKHLVTNQEAEEVFINQPIVVIADAKHSMTEPRFQALGKTNNSRPLFLSFTIRNNKVRIISIRNMNKKEKKEYEKF